MTRAEQAEARAAQEAAAAGECPGCGALAVLAVLADPRGLLLCCGACARAIRAAGGATADEHESMTAPRD